MPEYQHDHCGEEREQSDSQARALLPAAVRATRSGSVRLGRERAIRALCSLATRAEPNSPIASLMRSDRLYVNLQLQLYTPDRALPAKRPTNSEFELEIAATFGEL